MKRRSRRAGVTLFEVVLASAVLVMLGAIAYPSLRNSYAYFKLHGGIDSVRAAWAQARAHAIEEGRPYRFSVEPGGGHFRVAPHDPDYWSGSAPANDPRGKGYVLQQSLPAGVRFTVGNSPAPTPAEERDNFNKPDTTNYAAISWSTAVVFGPDGTAKDDVKILFRVQGAQPTRVHLRGLTGGVTVTPVQP